MYALPGQTLAMARADIARGARAAPPHLSFYQLTLEPNTRVREQAAAAARRRRARRHAATRARRTLGGAGYEHYEMSAYAQPGSAAAHNLNYWRFGDYLGIGAGAHGKISFPDRITRQSAPSSLRISYEMISRLKIESSRQPSCRSSSC